VGFLSYFINLGAIAVTITFYSFITKRSVGRRCSSIGIWNRIFVYLSYVGVLYNTIIILVPGNNLIGLLDSEERERVVIMAFILENIIVFLKFMLKEAIPNIPRWIELRLKKEHQARILNEENLRNALSHVAKKDDDNVLLIKEEKELKHVYDNGNKI